MVAGRLPQSASPLLGFCSSVHRSCSPHRRSSSSDHGRRTPTVMKPGSAARETGRTVPKTMTITTTPSSSAASDCEDTSSPHGLLCHLHHRSIAKRWRNIPSTSIKVPIVSNLRSLFPNHIPNPEDKTAMKAITQAVLDNKADLGIIFDTDVDRSAAVDFTGREFNRNRLIALMAAIVLEEHPGTTIVTDSVTSDGLTTFIEKKLGGKHHRFKRGYKNVIDEAIRLV
ncbi:uncharacterized protein HKW66_Vig0254970 [Vigna angularis]|uniref:phosphoglucomutase (alpha-D-glucose-1,6-bisphosphate-dependent) n=2 Tax=Phaseolus angularis TaxID=3914 RepID=A0A8T0JT66_PHAAN|nr:uncharacterized protein HKW66_Vig0254970 [Vigna angularis]